MLCFQDSNSESDSDYMTRINKGYEEGGDEAADDAWFDHLTKDRDHKDVVHTHGDPDSSEDMDDGGWGWGSKKQGTATARDSDDNDDDDDDGSD